MLPISIVALSTETYTGCSGITSPPSIVWPAPKLGRFTTLMSERSVSLSTSYPDNGHRWCCRLQPHFGRCRRTARQSQESPYPPIALALSPLSPKTRCSRCLHNIPTRSLILCLCFRFGTSQDPSLLLLGSEALVLALFTLFPIALMCLSSSPLGGIKPATTLRWTTDIQRMIMVSTRWWTCETWHPCDRCLENDNWATLWTPQNLDLQLQRSRNQPRWLIKATL